MRMRTPISGTVVRMATAYPHPIDPAGAHGIERLTLRISAAGAGVLPGGSDRTPEELADLDAAVAEIAAGRADLMPGERVTAWLAARVARNRDCETCAGRGEDGDGAPCSPCGGSGGFCTSCGQAWPACACDPLG
jgi:hypothetical protein